MATNNSCDYSPTQHNVQVGGANGTLSNVAPSATSGVPVISQGASSDPTFGTAVVAGGGTGLTSATAYAVLCGGTTSTAAFQSIAGVGTSGQFLTSNGAGALPTFQSAGAASITITGDSGGGLTGSSFTFTGGTTGLTFAGAGSTETLGGTLVVSNGGTGRASSTAYAVICGGTSSTAAQQSIAGVGTSGQVLTSNGAGALPTFQAIGGTSLSSASITITSAQAKALHATPQTIVAAPGAGKVILPFMAEAQLNYGGTNAFTNTGSGTLELFYGSSSGSIAMSLLASTQITATSNQIGLLPLSGVFAASSAISNTALVASQTSATEFAGNAAADNTITVTVWYLTITP